MRKIIFLDFDGALNTEYYQGLLQFQEEQWQDGHVAFSTRKQFDNLNESLMQRVRILWLNHRGSISVWRRCRNCGGLVTCLEE